MQIKPRETHKWRNHRCSNRSRRSGRHGRRRRNLTGDNGGFELRIGGSDDEKALGARNFGSLRRRKVEGPQWRSETNVALRIERRRRIRDWRSHCHWLIIEWGGKWKKKRLIGLRENTENQWEESRRKRISEDVCTGFNTLPISFSNVTVNFLYVVFFAYFYLWTAPLAYF